ncbi:OmpH family outer membrane protein [Dysgonomonas sp. HDW5A]|uniref:OmpH family outer membrane protein n=1 Tax=Dysgonomonas sp. HDW5A TaxID=2714926 RepID=UPI0014083256|nr:OmpH family outer membrane protein [Dysgonomonas sp. HDW5A]QIK60003.1 OmpH family outer membrane protein [Dysgonomonas sp. HDW5A]
MMAKRIFLSALFIISIVFINNISAQTSDKIAYINSIELLEVIPGKVAASRSISDLNQKYKDELAVMQNDYNNKYTDFLANQNKLAESIKLRRMQELYELEQNINRFMKVAQEDVESQEAQLIAPLKERLKEAVNQVGIEQGFTCIYDMANPTIAFITPNAIDANPMVKAKLQQTRR